MLIFFNNLESNNNKKHKETILKHTIADYFQSIILYYSLLIIIYLFKYRYRHIV